MPRAREILGTQTEVIDEESDSELEKHLSYREMVVYPQEGSQFCKLNLARAPWWGGFFKRLIGRDHEKGTFKGSWPKPSDLSRAGRYLD